MTRVAIYARYSSDLQSDASIEDQLRLCSDRAKREGWRVINRYTDHGISGASLIRPGIQALMQDAQAGRIDIVLAEALDRLSRDQEDTAGLYKRLEFASVKIITLSEGEISNLHVGLKGTMNALFLKDLADKTRRGLSGRVEKGKSGGGLTYGYDVVKKFNAQGEAIRGERSINDEQARIVRRIFEEYLAGKSPKMIATRLNKESVPGPSGKDWGQSTINGNRDRGTGILNNELYIGRLVWNRLRYVKDPETGKRVSRLNPEDQWLITEVPELRLIDQGLWDAVKTKQGKINKKDTPLWQKNRPRHLLSHLLRCGECGGGYSMINQAQLGCSNARNKGTCDNRLSMKRETVEEGVLTALQDHLMDAELCAVFCDEYVRHMNEVRKKHNASIAGYQAEFGKINRQIDKMVDAIADGAPVANLKDKMWQLENRRLELKEILESTEEAPVLFHPNMARRYHQEVQRLIRSLNQAEHRAEAAEILRSLIDKIVLRPTTDKDRLTVDLIGDLAGILSVATQTERPLIESGLSLYNPAKQEALVAGTGFEPMLLGLIGRRASTGNSVQNTSFVLGP